VLPDWETGGGLGSLRLGTEGTMTWTGFPCAFIFDVGVRLQGLEYVNKYKVRLIKGCTHYRLWLCCVNTKCLGGER
jgi:hypothetical protein